MKYGQAQKIVNMAFKYMYCVWYGKKEYKEYLEKCEVCHMPLDSFSLEWINRCYIKGKNLKKYAKDFDDTVWNQKSLKKEVYSLKQDKEKGPIGSWSTLERGIDEEKSLKCTYQFYVKLLHDELGDVSPLLVDFYVWPRMQMILSAEAFIKTFKVYFNRYFHSNGQREKGGGSTAMKKQKLNYRFHNPNTAEVTADYILKVFIEVNAKKVERVMQEVAEKSAEEDKQEEK